MNQVPALSFGIIQVVLRTFAEVKFSHAASPCLLPPIDIFNTSSHTGKEGTLLVLEIDHINLGYLKLLSF